MKHLNKQFISLTFGALTLLFVLSEASVAAASEITPTKVIELVNQDRAKQGISPLLASEALTHAAQTKADDMAQHVYFAHTSPEGITPWYWIQQSGYTYRFAGENLAIHFTDAEDQEKAWMASIKHKENIVNLRYQDIGVAVEKTLQNGQETIIVVQMFGLPLSSVLPVQSPSIHTPAQTSLHNALVSSVGFSQQKPAMVISSYEPSASHPKTATLWIQWIGFVIAIGIIARGLLYIRIHQKRFSLQDVMKHIRVDSRV